MRFRLKKTMERAEIMEKYSKEIIALTKENLTVHLNPEFPQILDYRLGSIRLKGDPFGKTGLLINGNHYAPLVTCCQTKENTLRYILHVPQLRFEMEMCYTVGEDRLTIQVERIQEGTIKVRTIGLEDEILFSVDSDQRSATAAVVSNPERWKSIADEITEDLTQLQPGVTEHIYAMASADGLAVTVNSSSIRNAARFRRMVQRQGNKTLVSVGNNLFDYHMPDDTLLSLPWTVILLCGDYNADGKVDWKDAAANYRNIRTKVKGEKEIKNCLMWIAYNAGSQVQEPFLKTLDTGKAVYNYTDGFGQMIMFKGYQAEGHDDSHGDYGGNIGVRQGGKEALNTAIALGKQYNILSGVHINVNEHMADARRFNREVLKEPCSPGWNFFDQAYFVDQEKDILSGNRKKNLAELKQDLPQLDFVYVDIYGIEDPADWYSNDLIRTLHEFGWIIGTEFSGPMEQGTAFTHWGHDIAYPNECNESRIMRYFKHDFDIFRGDALTMGSLMLPIASWEHRCDMGQGVEIFYNHTLISKYLQHHPILDYEDDYVIFADGVKTQRLCDRIVLTKFGRKMAYWSWSAVNPQKPVRNREERTGDAVLFLPWFGENSKTRNPDDADKIYHWNAFGGETTWDVPENWEDGEKADLYELSRSTKTLVDTLTVQNGKLTLHAKKNTPYVLYRQGEKPCIAGNFGEGTPLKNPGFDTPELSMWHPEMENAHVETTMSSLQDPRLTMQSNGIGWAEICQVMQGLRGGKTYTVYLFADISAGAQLTIKVSCGGRDYAVTKMKSTLPAYNIVKYAGTFYQKVKVTFDLPSDENKALLRIRGCFERLGGCINLDDIRVWENETRSPQITDPGWEDYLIYEDFENVEQGYGCFVPAGNEGSAWDFQAHIAEKTEGQYLDYVVNGGHSLKIDQGGADAQTLLRTHPNDLKLEPDMAYDIAFGYLTGVTGRHVIRVKNDSGNVVYEYVFEDTGLESGTHSLASRFISDTFHTDGCDNYYLSIDLVDGSITAQPELPEEGSAAERTVLSVDDISIRVHKESN